MGAQTLNGGLQFKSFCDLPLHVTLSLRTIASGRKRRVGVLSV